MIIKKFSHGVRYRQGKTYFFFPKTQLSLKSEQLMWHVYIWGEKKSIIIARKYCLGTTLFHWESQPLKGPRAALLWGRCCHADELWLVGKQVQERSLQITLSLVLRKTKAASGISAKKGWKCRYRQGGSWGRWELWNAFISVLWSTIAYWSTSVKIRRDGLWHKCAFWIS